ncbi:Cse1-domain-containing protein, partial [Chytridium lagenaria]
AESALASMETSPGFSLSLLNLCQSDGVDPTVRFAGIVYFKNFVKKYWKDVEASKISPDERAAIKAAVVNGLGVLRGTLQLQLSETVALIAEDEFPDRWPTLILELRQKLTMEDYSANLGILEALHSIFKRWRHQERTDVLFTAILKVLQEFSETYLLFFKATDNLIDNNAQDGKVLTVAFQSLLLLMKIFYSLNCQDLPEFFEENQEQFMGFFQKYLTYNNEVLNRSSNDEEAGVVEKVKSAICEVISLYASKYEEDFPKLPDFVHIIWSMLTTLGPQAKYDTLVCKSMDFLTVVVRPVRHRAMFENMEIIQNICEKIVLPNITMRDTDEENFEDGGFEVIRHDLEGSEFETRRKSATDLIRGLLEHFSNEITGIMTNYLTFYFDSYLKDPVNNWRSKDTALYLVMALAAKTFSNLAGITTMNELVDPIPIFSVHVLPDLQSPFGSNVKDIIRMDALKFVVTFRAQLNKQQIIELLPLIAHHLTSPNVIVATYAAVCVERFLILKKDNAFLLTKNDIKPFSSVMFRDLFALIYRGGSTPDKVAENDYALKSIMRIIAIMADDVLELVGDLLTKFNAILEIISVNPSNPKFNHFLFESLGLLIRNISISNPVLVEQFEAVLFPPFQAILQKDISEYTPYVFQLFSQMLSLHQEAGIPTAYEPMLAPLLLPPLWDSQGNIPALVSLLENFLVKGKDVIIRNNQLQQILGIFQKLISSRQNDTYGFELIETVYEAFPMEILAPYHKNIFMLILQRLMTRRTPKFTKGFLHLLSVFILSENEKFNADTLVDIFDALEPGLFAKVLKSVIIVELLTPFHLPADRKLYSIAFTHLLTSSSRMFTGPNLPLCPEVIDAVRALISTADAERKLDSSGDERGIVDFEDYGYQSTFVKLSSASKKRRDPTVSIVNHKQFVMEQLMSLRNMPKAGVLPPTVFSSLG